MFEIIISWLLLFVLLYLLVTSAILVHNRFYLTELPASDKKEERQHPKISVCIPARNEEDTISGLLTSIVVQKYPDFEVLILDDQSEDSTPVILNSFKDQYPDLIIPLKGSGRPPGWLGKSWACQQLGEKASGQILLFLDADTVLKPGMLLSASAAFTKHKTDMITVWPHQIYRTWWEKTVMPIVYYTLLTLLPTYYAYKKPRLMPQSIYSRVSSLFSAANGQCIAFKRKAYHRIGGHVPVKSEIVEDVKLAKKINEAGFTMRMYTGQNTITCRMYSSQSQMFQGFRKNFFAGFDYNLSLFTFSSLLHFAVFILPFIILPASLIMNNRVWFELSVAAITMILLQRLIIALWQRWNPFYAFTHPVGVMWFQFLALTTVFDYLTRRKIKWKEREI
jgi:chlorobactene glucosyltransferase